MKNFIKKILPVTLFALLVSACGQSGPLYLPKPDDQKPEVNQAK